MVRAMGEDGLIPRQRNRLPVMCAAALGTLALGFSFLLDSDGFTERIGLIALCITLEKSLYSLCLFAEEWIFHLKQRYHGKISRMIQACFNGHVLLGMFVIFLLLKLGGVSFSNVQMSTISLTCAVYLFSKSLPALVRFILIEE